MKVENLSKAVILSNRLENIDSRIKDYSENQPKSFKYKGTSTDELLEQDKIELEAYMENRFICALLNKKKSILEEIASLD